jgi:hypothetical protein
LPFPSFLPAALSLANFSIVLEWSICGIDAFRRPFLSGFRKLRKAKEESNFGWGEKWKLRAPYKFAFCPSIFASRKLFLVVIFMPSLLANPQFRLQAFNEAKLSLVMPLKQMSIPVPHFWPYLENEAANSGMRYVIWKP